MKPYMRTAKRDKSVSSAFWSLLLVDVLFSYYQQFQNALSPSFGLQETRLLKPLNLRNVGPAAGSTCSQAFRVIVGIEPVTFSLVVCVGSPAGLQLTVGGLKTLQPAAACLPTSTGSPRHSGSTTHIACVCLGVCMHVLGLCCVVLHPRESANHQWCTL